MSTCRRPAGHTTSAVNHRRFAARLLSVAFSAYAAATGAATLTVTSTADTNGSTCTATCTLRQAINAANASVLSDTIRFAVPGAGPHIITPATALPTLATAITIDGYSQPGAVENSSAGGFNGVVAIRLVGTALPTGSVGLRAQTTALPVVISGLSITGFSGTTIGGVSSRAIVASGAGQLIVRGCLLGLTPAFAPAGNDIAIEIEGAQTGAVSIGSSDPLALGARNLISANADIGILARPGNGSLTIAGNLIGTDATGNGALGNGGAGISMLRSGAVVRDNVVGASTIGIRLQGSNFVLTGNRIGIGSNLATAIGNGTGIVLNAASPAGVGVIGGAGAQRNVIAGNSGDGIEDFAGQLDVDLAQNRFFRNGGFGIDLRGSDGATANDPGDADSGPNGLQNAPVITSATRPSSSGGVPITIAGTLNSLPARSFRLVFYAVASAGGGGDNEGEFTGDLTQDVTTDAGGNASFGPLTVNFGPDAINIVTATATLLDATSGTPRATSELSAFANLVILPPPVVLVVNSAADPGDGSCNATCTLRDAVLAANASAGGQVAQIQFAIPGSAAQQIVLASPLPVLNHAMLIDGYSQPGAAPNSDASGVGSNAVLKIEVSPTPAATFDVFQNAANASNIALRGLAFTGFNPLTSEPPTFAMVGSNTRIEGCWFGVRPDGSELLTSLFVIINGENTVFGGDAPSARNVWVNQRFVSVRRGRVSNNLFGILPDGRSEAEVSVFLDGNGNVGGGALRAGGLGPITVENNVFSTPLGVPAVVAGGAAGGAAQIIDNAFGESADGTTALSLGTAVEVGAPNVTIRSATRPIRNPLNAPVVIATNTQVGPIILDQTILGGQGSGVLHRLASSLSIRSAISGPTSLGIDLNQGVFGVTPNDPGDNDVGANGLQNFPELFAAQRNGSTLIVTGLLDSNPNQQFRILVCGLATAHSTDHGGCDQVLDDQTIVATDASGSAEFSISVPNNPLHQLVTATASRIITIDVEEQTSEFAQNIPITDEIALFGDGFE